MREVGTNFSDDHEIVIVTDEANFRDSEPLLYVEVITHKKDSTGAVKRLIAKVRDDHGHMPREVLVRLHSDKGQ